MCVELLVRFLSSRRDDAGKSSVKDFLIELHELRAAKGVAGAASAVPVNSVGCEL